MRNAVIVDIVRTAAGKGKPGGALSGVHPVDLLAGVLEQLAERNGLDPALVEDVIGGCVGQAGEQSLNIARQAVLAAGWPESVPATTVDRQCGSSQQAAHFAAQGVMAGAYDVVVACGVESMSRVPMGTPAMGQDPLGPKVRSRYPDGLVNQGVSAELIADRWKLSREELDEFAARSHRLAAQAADRGAFDREVVPVRVRDAEGREVDVRRDETVRAGTTVEALAQLPTSFDTAELRERFPDVEWKITPGNSSPLTDGASGALIMAEEVAERLGLTPRARFHAFAVAGDDPILMLTAPVPASQQVLARAGMTIDDLDVYEVNEAFAPVPLFWQREMNADPDRLNRSGGAIALGHPLGASGTRVMSALLHELEATGGRYGLQTMCEGNGLANATIIERL